MLQVPGWLAGACWRESVRLGRSPVFCRGGSGCRRATLGRSVWRLGGRSVGLRSSHTSRGWLALVVQQITITTPLAGAAVIRPVPATTSARGGVGRTAAVVFGLERERGRGWSGGPAASPAVGEVRLAAGGEGHARSKGQG